MSHHQKFSNSYQQLRALPVLTSARYAGRDVSIGFRLNEAELKCSVGYTQRFREEGDVFVGDMPVIGNENVLASVTSGSGKVSVAFQKGEEDKGHFVVFKNGTAHIVDVKDTCSAVRLAGHAFCGYSFSPDESLLLFVGEKKKTKKTSYWDKPDESVPGEQFDLVESFGEQLSQVFTPQLFMLDIDNLSLSCPPIPESLSAVSKPSFTSSNSFIFIGYPELPRKLGSIFYNSRESSLYSYNTETGSLLNLYDKSVVSPIVRGNTIMFLSTGEAMFHNSCMKLCKVSVPEGDSAPNVSTVVPICQSRSEDFAGFWQEFVRKSWISDDVVAVTSPNGSRKKVFLVNINTGNISKLSLPDSLSEQFGECDMTFHDAKGGNMLISLSNFTIPFSVWKVSCSDPSQWKLVHSHSSISGIEFKILPFQTSDPAFQAEVVLIHPSQDALQPVHESTRLFIWPHGGPHSVVTISFSFIYAYLVRNGFALALVNYRGSSGFGQDFLESLPGHIGDYDVQDCLTSVDVCLENAPSFLGLSRDNLSVCGGSHGGFLTTAIIAQEPDLFKAAIARNPVTNISHNHGISDIPDWCMIECGLDFDPKTVPTADQYKVMYEMSPVSQIHKVKTPLLLFLGDKDRRVPMSQGIEYYRLLKANDVPSRCIVYPDNQHSLNDKVDTEADMWVNFALWMNKY